MREPALLPGLSGPAPGAVFVGRAPVHRVSFMRKLPCHFQSLAYFAKIRHFFEDGLAAHFLFVVKNLLDFEGLLDRTLDGLGYELADWERGSSTGLMRVFIDKPAGVNVDDCALVSNHLSQVLAVEGVEYGRLEVSSPGLDRMLRKERDFARFAGEKARLKLRVAHEGQRNFIGTLGAVKDGKLELDVDGKLIVFELANLDRARLVPNI